MAVPPQAPRAVETAPLPAGSASSGASRAPAPVEGSGPWRPPGSSSAPCAPAGAPWLRIRTPRVAEVPLLRAGTSTCIPCLPCIEGRERVGCGLGDEGSCDLCAHGMHKNLEGEWDTPCIPNQVCPAGFFRCAPPRMPQPALPRMHTRRRPPRAAVAPPRACTRAAARRAPPLRRPARTHAPPRAAAAAAIASRPLRSRHLLSSTTRRYRLDLARSRLDLAQAWLGGAPPRGLSRVPAAHVQGRHVCVGHHLRRLRRVRAGQVPRRLRRAERGDVHAVPRRPQADRGLLVAVHRLPGVLRGRVPGVMRWRWSLWCANRNKVSAGHTAC